MNFFFFLPYTVIDSLPDPPYGIVSPKNERMTGWKIHPLNEAMHFLSGGNSNIFYFHPGSLGKWSNLTIICLKWVETLWKPPTSFLLKMAGFST